MTSKTSPPTETLPASAIRQQWNEAVSRVAHKGSRLLVEQDGTVVAALISAEDLRRLELLDEQRERDFALLEELSQVFDDVSPEEIEREVAAAVAEVRVEQRRRAATPRAAS